MYGISSGDTTFVLISAALVCLMTPGLAFFYGGLVRTKNILTIMLQNFICMGVVTIIWVIFGFSLAFGPSIGGIIGNFDHLFLNGVGIQPSPVYGTTIPFLAFFLFQQMFAVITPALITGAFADRMNFKSYLQFIILWSIFVYIPATHWIWGGGFLAKLGVVDFAGGIVANVTCGMAALACVFFLGNRKISPGESTAPGNIAYVALGTALLWFGWFGFNGGSALAANGVATIAFVNTNIAGAVAMVVWLIITWVREKKPTMVGALTGSIAGLATIAPSAGYVEPWAAILIGILASIVCYGAVLLEIRLGWDDSLEVWGVHGVAGILGSILIGIFASKSVNGISGLIDGNLRQLGVQIAAVVIVGIYAYIVTYLILKIINTFSPVRVSPEVEEKGLDESLHGEHVYGFCKK